MNILVIGVLVLQAFLVLQGTKTALGILVCMYLLLVYLACIPRLGTGRTHRYIVLLVIATLPFPYLVQFQGKDALTVTTLIIMLLFGVTFVAYSRGGSRILSRHSSLCYLPIAILLSFSVSLVFNPSFLWQSIRYLLANASGILLYFLIIKWIRNESEVKEAMGIILFVLVLQAVFSWIQLAVPAAAQVFAMFATRTEVPAAQLVDGILRATGTVGDYELLAQWFMVGALFSVYFIIKQKTYVYLVPLAATIAGIIFTKTRSAILVLSVVFCMIVVGLFIFKKAPLKQILKLCLFVCGVPAVLALIFPRQIQELVMRMSEYVGSGDLFSAAAINRDIVWENAFRLLKTPRLFGHGLYNVESFTSSVGSFHSLYLTLLYKIGLVGLGLHVIFWMALYRRAWKVIASPRPATNWHECFFLAAAISMLLLDGIKIEYLRYAHTIQFTWMMYGLAVVSSVRAEEPSGENNENIVVSPAAV